MTDKHITVTLLIKNKIYVENISFFFSVYIDRWFMQLLNSCTNKKKQFKKKVYLLICLQGYDGKKKRETTIIIIIINADLKDEIIKRNECWHY